MSKRIFACIILLICSSVIALCQDVSFRIPLILKDTVNAPDTIYFGVHPNATKCIDDSLGEYEVPYECWLPFGFGVFIDNTYPSCLGQGVRLDLRNFENSSQIDTYFVKWCAYIPLTLRWHSNIALYYDSAKITDLFGGIIIKVNMLMVDSFMLSDNRFDKLLILTYGPKSPTGVSLREAKLPETTELKQNYPNPFNPSTRIQYSVSRNQYVSLKIFDVLGREVTTLVDETQPPGTYQVEWNAESMPNGVYFYRLRVGNNFETKRMLLIK